MFAFSTFLCYTIFAVGDIAQLEERLNGIQRGSGSIPLISTKGLARNEKNEPAPFSWVTYEKARCKVWKTSKKR